MNPSVNHVFYAFVSQFVSMFRSHRHWMGVLLLFWFVTKWIRLGIMNL